MADINRVGSSMDFCDEGLDAAPGEVEERKRRLEAKQQAKSPFLIGTIEDVNRKIGKLEQRLQSYTQLVVESRASDHPDLQETMLPGSARGRQRYQERERENKDVCKFAGIYTFKSTFLPHLSNRVKNISKISMAPGRERTVKKEKDTVGKPRFVELHQYPGYDPTELTPLPGNVSAVDILQYVVDASVNLDKKPAYRPEFQRLFFSPMSLAILQDMFWYMFLEHFQPNAASQHKLFNRVAHNYVKLMMYAKNPLFRDTFLKDYPTLMSQAVYSSFCHCFPDSYRQFGETFRDAVVFLVFGWIAGIRPSPRFWSTWNITALEPPNIRTKGDAVNKKKKPALSFNFDYLDSLVSSHPSQYPSSVSLNQSASKSSMGSTRGPRRARKHHGTNRNSQGVKVRSSSEDRQGRYSSSSSQDTTFNLIDAVADAQKSPVKSTARDSLLETSRSSHGKQTARDGSETQRSQNTRLMPKDKDGAGDGLSPIRELATEEDEEDRKMSQLSPSVMQNLTKAKSEHEMVSHPACRGAEFLKAAFNINGRSPLVDHFLRVRNLASDHNLVVRMSRTQIESLPPLDAQTYQDVIRESSKTIRIIEKQFQEMYAKNQRESAVFLKQEQEKLRLRREKESALLANTDEVKRLSDLIILEQKKGLDSLSAGASQALEAALMNQD